MHNFVVRDICCDSSIRVHFLYDIKSKCLSIVFACGRSSFMILIKFLHRFLVASLCIVKWSLRTLMTASLFLGIPKQHAVPVVRQHYQDELCLEGIPIRFNVGSHEPNIRILGHEYILKH